MSGAGDAPGGRRFEVHVPIEADGVGALDVLAERTDLSRRRLKQVMSQGAVWLTREGGTRRLRRAAATLRAGDELHLYHDEEVLAAEPPAARLLADEGAYSVWDKPAGMLSQGSKWGDHCTIGRWCERHLTPERPAFVVHRLDRAASGLMLIAHKKQTAEELSRLLRERAIVKRYRVTVHGRFPEGSTTIDEPLDDKAARTRARRLEHDATTDRSVLEVTIETGRKHQIRRHLAGLGFPVVGDRVHGRPEGEQALHLRACHLAFRCPLTGEDRVYDLPDGVAPPG